MKNNKFITVILDIMQVLFVYFGVYSSMMCMADSFSLTYNDVVVVVLMLLSAFIFYAMFSVLETIKKGKIYGIIGIIVFYLIIAWRFHIVIHKGIVTIANAYLKEFMSYTHNTMTLLKSSADSSISLSYATTFVIVFVGTFIIALVSSFFYRKRRAIIFIMSTIFFFAIPISVGKMGDFHHVTMYIIVLMIVMATRFLPNDFTDKWMRQKLSLIVMAVGIFTILLIEIFMPMDKYESNIGRIEQFRNSATALVAWDKEDVMTFIREYFGGDVMEYGKIGEKNAINPTGKTLMKVSGKMDPNQGVYMKGYIGSEYSDNHWHKVTDKDEMYDKKRKTLDKDGLSVDGWHVTLRNQVGDSQQSGNSELWDSSELRFKNLAFGYGNYLVPYYPTVPFEADGSRTTVAEKGIDYKAEFYPMLNKSFRNALAKNNYDIASGDYWESSNNIRTRLKDFVDTYYLTVPEDLKGVCDEYKSYLEANGGIFTAYQGGTCSMYHVINATVTYIFSNTTYTLEPGKTPFRKDAVEYFLKENKRGYCNHYATAAAVLLRSVGIPTRYVEGVYVPKEKIKAAMEAGKSLAITDEDVHAWIEVYQENYGFIPVEVTPGRGEPELSEIKEDESSSDKKEDAENKGGDSGKGSDAGTAENNKDTDVNMASATPVPEDNMEFENIKTENYNHEDIMESGPLEGGETSSVETGSNESGGNAGGSIMQKGWFKGLLIVLGFIVFAVAAVIIQRKIRVKLFKKKLADVGMRKRILMQYRHIQPALAMNNVVYSGQSMMEMSDELVEAYGIDSKHAYNFVKSVYSASFSKNDYDKSWKIEFKNAYKKLRNAVYENENIFRKLYCKYILCL